MTADTVLGLAAPQLVLLLTALSAIVVVLEAWIGHYRSGFPLRTQYLPFAAGGLLALSSLAYAFASTTVGTRTAIIACGWTAVATGILGAGYHHYYGIAKKAGAYRWLLHYLMYGAPPLAPLALSAFGTIALVVAAERGGPTMPLSATGQRTLLAIVSVALTGAVAQSGILHYRGAFNTPLMYVPLTIPVLAILVAGWTAVTWATWAPIPATAMIGRALFWMTFLAGFVGLGMHLRGIDRQMGGAHLWRINLLQGPPPLAPAMFSAFSALGILALRGL